MYDSSACSGVRKSGAAARRVSARPVAIDVIVDWVSTHGLLSCIINPSEKFLKVHLLVDVAKL
jgi:hypothetical protein